MAAKLSQIKYEYYVPVYVNPCAPESQHYTDASLHKYYILINYLKDKNKLNY